jgi:hypothetical protein
MEQTNSVPVFADCSAESVFSEISSKITTSEGRALWVRLQDEIRRQGVGASSTYLGGDPSQSFDTSHVTELVKELALASEHAQLFVATHEREKF